MRKIKRYKYNRKLYDYASGGYINLSEIVQAVKDQEEFCVVDETGIDVTDDIVLRAVQTQVKLSRQMCNNIIRGLYETSFEPGGAR
jgi:polyhydroxyalkanoate synthesis regulator protein